MPKIGMEPIRRDAIVKATIAELGVQKSLDVTVSQIAKRAGMSSALAHHYFGGKDQIFLAAMRHILSEFGDEARAEMKGSTPADRPQAIVRACFAHSCFTPDVIAAWMTFYVLSQTNDDALRLWRIYQSRLYSNLVHALRPVVRNPGEVANDLRALIDGLYIQAALGAPGEPDLACAHALRVLDTLIEAGK